MTEHKHAWVLREIADGACLDDYEVKFEDGDDVLWLPVVNCSFLLIAGEGEIRRKAKVIRIGDVELPEPVREPLAYGTEYFFINLAWDQLISKCEWTDHRLDRLALQRGTVHLTEDAARQHAKALILLSGGGV